MADGKFYKCEHSWCDKSFSRVGHLKAHTRIHTNEKPFKCKFSDCGKTFRTMYECAKHHKMIHFELRPYNCQTDGCTKSFANGVQLSRHYCFAKDQIAKRCKCEFAHCGKTFDSKYRLFKHQEIAHSSRKPFGCRIVGCFKSYTYATSLTRHMGQMHKNEACEKDKVSRGPRIAQPSAQEDCESIYENIEKEPQNETNFRFHSVQLLLMAELGNSWPNWAKSYERLCNDQWEIKKKSKPVAPTSPREDHRGTPPGDIQTQPNAKIVFNGPFELKHAYLIKVTNSSTHRIRFGIKTTNSERIHFVPSSGFLDPNETALVAMLCDAFVYKEDESNDDSITVEWANVPDGAVSCELVEDNEMVRRKKLPIEYNL